MDFLPYSRPVVEADDIAAVTQALSSPIISQGERLTAFEGAFAATVGARFGVAFSSGSAALHAMCLASGFEPGDEVVVPALTFVGTTNAVLHAGGQPVFADIEESSFCLDPSAAERALGPNARAILSVDFAGRPADYDRLRRLADEAGVLLLSDAAHAPGATLNGRKVGALADMTAFSFNPVKNLTSAEGGMVTTDRSEFVERLRMIRANGITRDAQLLEGAPAGDWYYEQQVLGLNFKLSEVHAALGLSQLGKLDRFNNRRREIAEIYRRRLADFPLRLPEDPNEARHVYHLFVIRLTPEAPITRDVLFSELRAENIGVQLHYIPVPMHPYYRMLGFDMDGLVETARYFATAMSIPVHPAMDQPDIDRVVAALERHLR